MKFWYGWYVRIGSTHTFFLTQPNLANYICDSKWVLVGVGTELEFDLLESLRSGKASFLMSDTRFEVVLDLLQREY